MILTRQERPVFIVNLIYIPLFASLALWRGNAEFVLYAGVVAAVAGLILLTQRRVRFPLPILWGLSIWGLLHMAGGNIRLEGEVLYSLGLISIVPDLNILRFDQVVHAFGFGLVTFMCHHLLGPYLKTDVARWGVLSFLIVLMGSGVGALNEILEFGAVLLVPETGVGGYENTLCDLVFNLIGGVIAVTFLTWRRVLRPVG